MHGPSTGGDARGSIQDAEHALYGALARDGGWAGAVHVFWLEQAANAIVEPVHLGHVALLDDQEDKLRGGGSARDDHTCRAATRHAPVCQGCRCAPSPPHNSG